jgi:hypothetical protein
MARQNDPAPVNLFRVQNLHAMCGSPSRFLLHVLKLVILGLNSNSATENEADPQNGHGARTAVSAQAYSRLAGTIFAVIAILHLIRALKGAEATLDGMTIPVEASWIGLLVSGTLAWLGFTARRD